MSISAKIIGVGSSVPKTVITNSMLEEIMDTTDEWIKKRTGIKERRVVTEETATSMAIDASKEALAHAKIKANDIDIIIGTTVTSDYATPSVASLVQKGIKCEKAVAMDIAAGCTGFIYAVTTMVSLMETLNLETGLIVSTETLSNRVNWEDRSTCILFGDGAGAVVIKRSIKNHIKHPIITGVIDENDVLIMNSKRNDNPWSKTQSNDDIALYMNGNDVFAFAVDAVEKTLKELQALMGEEKIDKIIPHQANSRIIRFAASSTDFDRKQFYVNVDKYANTSSATIPIALCEANESGWLKKGDNVALVGFVAGLTYGGIVIEWDL